MAQNNRSGGANGSRSTENPAGSIESTTFVSWPARCFIRSREGMIHEIQSLDRFDAARGHVGVRADSFFYSDRRRLRLRLLCAAAGVFCARPAVSVLWLRARMGWRWILG